MVAFVPIIMVLGRIAVKVGSKTVKDYLKKNGFRIAKNYKKYAETVTQKDLPALLKKVKDASGVKPSNVKGPGGSTMTTAGSRGQSALGRRLALSKLKSRGKTGPNTKEAPPMRELPKPKPATTGKKKPSAGPPTVKPSGAAKVAKRLVQGLNIAAAGGIAKVAYDAYKDGEIDKPQLEVYRENSSVLNKNVQSAIDRVLEADRIKALNDPRLKKAGTGRPTYKKRTPKQEAQIANTPARRKKIESLVREALTFKIPV